MKLFIFQHILNDPVIKALLDFKKNEDESSYYTAAQGLIKYSAERLTDKNIIREYVLRQMLEHNNLPDITSLRNFLRNDIKSIYNTFFETDWNKLAASKGLAAPDDISVAAQSAGLHSYALSIESMIDCTSNEALGGAVLAHAESFGTGITAAYAAFEWDGIGLKCHKTISAVSFDSLAGLSEQKMYIIENTERYIQGKSASNILFSGAVGTGKTACVEACLNLFKESGLRMIFISPKEAESLPSIIKSIDNSVLKYIIVIDGLDNEQIDFSDIPDTVYRSPLIYAIGSTNAKDESHFGIKLSFQAYTREEYLSAAANILKNKGIAMTPELKIAAIQYSEGSKELSGRLAQQFAAGILAK